MPIDLDELGRKCKRLREDVLQLALGTVADRSGIAEARLAAIELGRAKPSGDEILILADVLGEPVDYFLTHERSASVEKASELYRMYGKVFSPEDRQGIQEFLKLCRFEHEIESLLGASPRLVSFSPGPRRQHFKTDGRLVAEKLRHELGLGNSPIGNVFHLARRFGCHVFRRSLRNSRVSGLTLRHETYGVCILINYHEDLFRQNFSLAHELAHALIDTDEQTVVSFYKEMDERRDERKRLEWRANSFAAHLLFPQWAREALARTGPVTAQSVIKAAKHYLVNPVVVVNALREERSTANALPASLSGLMIPREEKIDADLVAETAAVRLRRQRHWEIGLAPDYVDLCVRAFRESEISFGRLADTLLASPSELPSLLQWLGYNEHRQQVDG